MPELPEVEVTRERIGPALVGRRIAAVHTTKQSYFFLTAPERLRAGLVGRRVLGLDRLGKYLVAPLDDGRRLVLHLGMTGQLFAEGVSSVRLFSASVRAALRPEEQHAFTPDAHTHLCLVFDDGGPAVIFRDVRKFGKVLLLGPGEKTVRLERLGVDALRATGADLFAAARKRTAPIKSLLLDQAVIAGAGNIYADEALFLTGVRPTRGARRLTRRQCDLLADALKRVLRRSIETGGSSISDYVAPDGRDGAYQDERRVYAREGQPCQTCETPIRRVVIGQRSAHFCPRCQA
jgi:formamidopyrimidine-DNA glycosylase